MNKSILLTSVIALAAMAAHSNATTYKWTWNGAGANNAGGEIKAVSSTYNSTSERFTFSTTLGNVPGSSQKPNAFWVAISDGPNPKGISGELPIFYFDASGSQPVLTAYAYNGQNGPNSYKDGNGNLAGDQTPDRIATSKMNAASWINSININNNADGSRTFKFDIKGGVVNGYTPVNGGASQWKGVEFENRFGIWFHPLVDAKTSYNQHGYLSSFSYKKDGWLDLSNQEAVPEPGTMAALGLGVAAMIRRRKAKKA